MLSGSETIHRRKARDQCTKSATRDKLSCDAEGREKDIDGNRKDKTDDGYNVTVLPRGQIDRADVLDLVLLSRVILVQIPHDEQLDREQNSHCVQIVNRVGRAGIARLDEQERTVAYDVENGDDLGHVLRDALEMKMPRMVHSTGRDTNWLMELRKVVMPPAFMMNGAMTIEMQPAMVP